MTKNQLQESSAAICSDVLISNDLRGNDSHGVSNMLRKVSHDFSTLIMISIYGCFKHIFLSSILIGT